MLERQLVGILARKSPLKSERRPQTPSTQAYIIQHVIVGGSEVG
jgi:hypothetical protein